MINNSPDDILKIIDELLANGRDLSTFADSVIKYLRDLMICKVSSEPDKILVYGSEDMVKLKAQCDKLSFEKITNGTTLLSDVKAEAKWVKAPRVIYELAFIRFARPEVDYTPEALMDRLKEMENKASFGGGADNSALEARVDALEKKLKNGVVPQSKAEEKKPEKKAEKTVSARLFMPIPQEELNGDNPIVVLAKKWDKLSKTICAQAAHLKAFLLNRPIAIDATGFILLFKRDEEFSKNLSLQYKNDLSRLFKKISGTDYQIKSAFEDELEGNIIDYWSLKPQSPQQTDETPESEDPLDAISNDFADIVELSDEKEFVNYNSEDDNFEQSEIDENSDSDEEEFLEGNEIPSDDE